MASATNNDEKSMATDELPDDEADAFDEQPKKGSPKEGGPQLSGGFFTIYKKGQGYWTRILSAVTAGFLVAATARFMYTRVPPSIPWLNDHQGWLIGIIVAFSVGSAILIWRVMNKPGNVDFLIATDSEMKKVNWTSRRELIGSTKVVIIFMFMIAILLFVLDMYFTRLFYLIGVLQVDAPVWDMVGRNFGLAGKAALDVVMGLVVFGGAAWATYSAARSR